MRALAWFVRTLAVYTLLSVGAFLMVRTTIRYSAFETDVQFLAFKQDYLGIPAWRFAFYVHVFSAVGALLAGFTQFAPVRGRLHRLVGRAYAVDILLVNFPAALVMAVYANGGLAGKASFLVLDVLWFGFTLAAVLEARRGNIPAHRAFMIRSYALTFSAITLRTWRIFLGDDAYVAEAWLGWVPNLLAAELWLRVSAPALRRRG